MAFSYLEMFVIIFLCLLPIIMGLILVAAAVWQKTGTSDVLTWPSSGGSSDVDPYEEMRQEHETEMGDDEESVYSDDYSRPGGLTRAAARSERSSDASSDRYSDHHTMTDRQSDRTSDKVSDKMSEYTYEY